MYREPASKPHINY
ncbi:hypothetical protein HMPREF9406_3407 [Clostridium sp. HGF2]|nr:hypothetical protein HMPREF9406_3407 [Clostridium sp. HGF2]